MYSRNSRSNVLPVGRFEARELLVGEHPRHLVRVAVPVVAVLAQRLDAVLEPLHHEVELVLLADPHPLGEQPDVAVVGALVDEAGHHDGLGVVIDHVAHEGHVLLDERRRLDPLRLLGRERAVRLARCSELHDRIARCGLRPAVHAVKPSASTTTVPSRKDRPIAVTRYLVLDSKGHGERPCADRLRPRG